MEHSPDLAAAGPAGLVASARESMAALAETLWAAARPEDLLDVTVELERLRSLVAAVEAQVAAEVEATEAAKTAGWVSPGDYLTACRVAGAGTGSGCCAPRGVCAGTVRRRCWRSPPVTSRPSTPR